MSILSKEALGTLEGFGLQEAKIDEPIRRFGEGPKSVLYIDDHASFGRTYPVLLFAKWAVGADKVWWIASQCSFRASRVHTTVAKQHTCIL
jgi:hypothetical protein